MIINDQDVCILWNFDATPTSKSSKVAVHLVQIQICNIPFKNRRNFQFAAGIYFGREKKPNTNSFSRPFVDELIKLYAAGIEWFDSRTNVLKKVELSPPCVNVMLLLYLKP